MRKRIICIDPGLANLGVSIVNPNLDILHSHLLKTKADTPQTCRLFTLGKYIKQLIESYAPKEMVVEAVFFGKNITSCIQTAEVIGMLKFISAMYGLEFFSYPPGRIKKQITGSGKSSKEEMLAAVNTLYNHDITNNHIADALAVGYVHYDREISCPSP